MKELQYKRNKHKQDTDQDHDKEQRALVSEEVQDKKTGLRVSQH